MTDFNANPDSAKQLWDRLPGEYDLHRVSNYDQLSEGRESASSDLERLSSGRSVITSCAPTDSAYQYECRQVSHLTAIEKESGVPKKTTETHIFRFLNGEWSVWRLCSDGVTLEKYANPTLKHETSAPAEQGPSKAQGTSFRVVQESKRTGKEKGDRLDLRFFRGEGAGWETLTHIKKGEKMMKQKDTYRLRQAKGSISTS